MEGEIRKPFKSELLYLVGDYREVGGRSELGQRRSSSRGSGTTRLFSTILSNPSAGSRSYLILKQKSPPFGELLYLVEAAGLEPASANPLLQNLHA